MTENKIKSSEVDKASEVSVDAKPSKAEPAKVEKPAKPTKVEKAKITEIKIKNDCIICMPGKSARPMRISFRKAQVVIDKNVVDYIVRNHSDIIEG